ncbi:MAG: 30S ribosomal protein S24e [Promethearchaeota archaeon]|nr:MAG: 30S ribosomal protein S24e [Candidatus Lokiarchaeota archaeon]
MSFDIEILEEKKNSLIDRVELKVKIIHFGNGTPNRMEIKKKIAAMKGSDENLTIIKKINTYFGSTEDIGKIYIYDNKNDIELFEPFHIRVRNLPKEKRTEIYNLKRKKEPYKHLFNE